MASMENEPKWWGNWVREEQFFLKVSQCFFFCNLSYVILKSDVSAQNCNSVLTSVRERFCLPLAASIDKLNLSLMDQEIG